MVNWSRHITGDPSLNLIFTWILLEFYWSHFGFFLRRPAAFDVLKAALFWTAGLWAQEIAGSSHRVRKQTRWDRHYKGTWRNLHKSWELRAITHERMWQVFQRETSELEGREGRPSEAMREGLKGIRIWCCWSKRGFITKKKNSNWTSRGHVESILK